MGDVTGNERFMRGNRQPGQFVGSDSSDLTNFLSAMGGALGQQQGQRGRRGQTANINDGDAPEQAGRTTIPFRIVLGFTPPAPRPAFTASTMNVRMQRSLVRISAESAPSASATPMTTSPKVTVNIDGRTAVLTGTVASEHARKVAEAMAKLEPGVSEVRNELVVANADGATP